MGRITMTVGAATSLNTRQTGRRARRWVGSLLGAVAIVALVVSPVALAAPGGNKGRPGGKTTTTTTTTTAPALVSVTLEVKLLGRATVGVLGDAAQVPVPLPDRGDTRRCTVQVPKGSDGAAVIEAARARGCIASYTIRNDEYGNPTYLECLDDRCNSTVGLRWSRRNWLAGGGTEWTHYEGAETIWWLHQFSAGEGRILTVSYGPTTGTCRPGFGIDSGLNCHPIVQVW